MHNPTRESGESKKERKARERREKKFRDAAFSYTPEQVQARMGRMPRHTGFDDKRRAGDRKQRNERAIRDSAGKS